MADWTELHPDLLQLISQNLTADIDYVRFRSVCHSWRSSLPKMPLHQIPPQSPWLMIPSYDGSLCSLFDFSGNKFRFLHLPEASSGKRRCGSSHGWLAILDETPTILLLNPLTRATRSLPPLSTFPNVRYFDSSKIGREYCIRTSSGLIYSTDSRKMRDSFIKKIVLSSSPTAQNDFTAVAILQRGGDLAFTRSGDGSWTSVDSGPSYCEDVVHSDGVFYAVDKHGVASAIDLRESRPRVSIIATRRRLFGDAILYMVKLGEELMLVIRYLGNVCNGFNNRGWNWIPVVFMTVRFEVFRMDWEAAEWKNVDNLGETALFVGQNSSIAVSGGDNRGISGNCIYYTDDHSGNEFYGEREEPDMGIFRLGDGSVETPPVYSGDLHPRRRSLPPIWVSPNPW